MQATTTAITNFQDAIKDIHRRIDIIEQRFSAIESTNSNAKGANSALWSLVKDLVIPVSAIIISYVIATNALTEEKQKPAEHYGFPPPSLLHRQNSVKL